MKQAKQKFITIVDEEGITNKAGIIHEWHEMCEDVDLQKRSEGSYKLHCTWLTVNGAYVRDFNKLKVR